MGITAAPKAGFFSTSGCFFFLSDVLPFPLSNPPRNILPCETLSGVFGRSAAPSFCAIPLSQRKPPTSTPASRSVPQDSFQRSTPFPPPPPDRFLLPFLEPGNEKSSLISKPTYFFPVLNVEIEACPPFPRPDYWSQPAVIRSNERGHRTRP